MSDLRPTGVEVNLRGEKRHLLFTLNAIDELENQMDKPVLDILEDLTAEETLPATLKKVLLVLVNDEAERERDRDPESKVGGMTERQMGWAITSLNIGELTRKVLEAYGISMPEPDEDDDPNWESGRNG